MLKSLTKMLLQSELPKPDVLATTVLTPSTTSCRRRLVSRLVAIPICSGNVMYLQQLAMREWEVPSEWSAPHPNEIILAVHI